MSKLNLTPGSFPRVFEEDYILRERVTLERGLDLSMINIVFLDYFQILYGECEVSGDGLTWITAY